MIGITVFIIAIILFIPLTIWNVTEVAIKYKTWKSIDGYFFQSAYDIDRFGNSNFKTILNKYLITADGYQFGDIRETMSSVLGKNERDGTLRKTGKDLIVSVERFDKRHFVKSIKELQPA